MSTEEEALENLALATIFMLRYREAFLATRAYHSNNNGENAVRYKKAIEALPKGWDRPNSEVNKFMNRVAKTVHEDKEIEDEHNNIG